MRKSFLAVIVFLGLVISYGTFAQETPAPPAQPDNAVTAAPAPSPAPKAESGKWFHESELGVALAGGNSSSKTVNAKQKTGYDWAKNIITLGGHYLFSTSNGVDSANNWDGTLKYERELSNTLSAFLGHGWEGDTFAGYDYRTNNDIGAKFYFYPGDKKTNYFLNETGYRYSYENRIATAVPPTANIHYIRIYLDGAKAITSQVQFRLWVEALPDMTDKNNVALNFEPSMNVLISKYLYLKLGYLGKYDNVPAEAGLKKYDWLYTTALVAKY